ncbi:MAG: hypothetical protein HQ559_13705 [Lentisphaerae bacterium]|nr:hypothetical protein [Lentisphaerota bacterium]
MGNSIFVIAPYKTAGTWVIDDPTRGLEREPFVAGIPKLIDRLTQDIPGAETGFRLLFSAGEFPGFTHKMTWKRKSSSGNWYYSEEFKAEGWLCPAFFKYFSKPPRAIYIKAEPIGAAREPTERATSANEDE